MSRPDRILQISIGPAGQPGLTWSDPMTMEARIKGWRSAKPDEAELKIWGLSDVSQTRLLQPGLVVVVRAGEETAGEIFRGLIARGGTRTVRDGPSWVTEIRAADSRSVTRSTAFARSYPPGTSSDLILQDIVAAMGLPIGFRGTLPSTTYPAGWAYMGQAAAALTRVLQPLDCLWMIQGGALHLLGPTDSLPGTAPLIQADSGLIGSPTTGKKVEWKQYFDARVRPGGRVVLKSEFASGTYTVVERQHMVGSGQSGAMWETRAKGVE